MLSVRTTAFAFLTTDSLTDPHSIADSFRSHLLLSSKRFYGPCPSMAEGEGFEPSAGFRNCDGLANRWFKPLTHPSPIPPKLQQRAEESRGYNPVKDS